MADPHPDYNRGEDYNDTIGDIEEMAKWAIKMGDLTSLKNTMESIKQVCEKTQTDPVDLTTFL